MNKRWFVLIFLKYPFLQLSFLEIYAFHQHDKIFIGINFNNAIIYVYYP